jgi:hypothetical protein
VADATNQLRATSDTLLLDLQTLADLEDLKRGTPHGDATLVELATRIEELAQRVLAGSRRQRELTESISEAVDSGELGASETIETTARTASAILADWRDAERAAIDAAPGSRERSEAEIKVAGFREEYRGAFEAARRSPG